MQHPEPATIFEKSGESSTQMQKPKTQYNIKYITTLSLVSALGGLLFGYDWVVIGGAKPFYEQFFRIAGDANTHLQGWAVSSALIGCIIGTLVSGSLSDNFGRKKLLISAAALFLISAIGTGISNVFSLFVVYRVIGGIGIGLASNLSPVYIAEISPADFRGRFVSIQQLTIVIGILLAQLINYLIAEPVPENATNEMILNSWNGQQGWRYMFWAEAVPASLFFLLMWFVPDSPRWLAQKGSENKARRILTKIGGREYAQRTINDIHETSKREEISINIKGLLNHNILPLVVVGIVLAVFQQWCGLNVIFLYADKIFSAAGYDVSAMLFNVVITGSVNLLFTLVAMGIVDRIGRKKMMITGSLGLAIIYTILGTFYFMKVTGAAMFILVLAAIACYAMTLAPVTWVLLSEIFPNRIRGAAMAVATFSLWTANAMLAFFFPIVNSALRESGSFWLFAGICVAGFVFIKTRLKETKGQTLEEIELGAKKTK